MQFSDKSVIELIPFCPGTVQLFVSVQIRIFKINADWTPSGKSGNVEGFENNSGNREKVHGFYNGISKIEKFYF